MSQALSAAERRALAAVCDTFFGPVRSEVLAEAGAAVDLDPERARAYLAASASSCGAVADAEETLIRYVPEDQAAQLRLVLRLLGSRLGVIFTLSTTPFVDMTPPERERVLRAWSTSPVGVKRKAFRALKGIAFTSVHLQMDPHTGKGTWWDALGYPGRRLGAGATGGTAPGLPPALSPPDGGWGAAPSPSPPEYAPFDFVRAVDGLELQCDVVIVGSGAGGGVAAGILAQAGLDVVVLEKGTSSFPSSSPVSEKEVLDHGYEGGGRLTSEDGAMSVFAGATFGGGTAINWACSLRTPFAVREEWASEHGVGAAVGPEFQRALDAVCERTNVHSEGVQHNSWNRAVLRGCRRLGYDVSVAPQNTAGEGEGEGGHTWPPQPRSKQSMVLTWLRDAARCGARFLDQCRADRVLMEGGRAAGVECTCSHGGGTQRVVVRARTVVVACGALHSPLLLRRSGMRNPHIGANLRLHPVTGVFGLFDEPQDGHEGAPMTTVSNAVADVDGAHYGAKLECPSAHPGVMSAVLPWEGAAAFKKDMLRHRHVASVIVLTRDRYGGSVVGDDAGRPRVHYTVAEHDRRAMVQGMQAAARILVAAGAREVATAQAGVPRYAATSQGTADPGLADYLRTIREAGVQANRTELFSAHQMGTVKLGRSHKSSAARADGARMGELWEAEGVYIADTSAFPTCTGANPMISVEALAHVIASRLASRLARPTASL